MKNRLHGAAWVSLFVAWIVALVATLGALFVGEIMGQTPCVLCWYQRIFMFPLALILGLAVWQGDRGVWRYVLPLCGVGLLMAGYHVLVFYALIPEAVVPCGRGPSCSDAEMTIFGGLPLPVLSLLAFVAISLLVAQAQSMRNWAASVLGSSSR